MKIGGGMVFYMHGVLDEEVVGWTSSLALKVTPSHYWILAHFLCQQYGFIVFYGFSFLFMLSKTRQKWKVFLPNRTHIILVQKFGNLGFDDFEPLKFSSVQIFKNVHCILISKRPSKFSCEGQFPLWETFIFWSACSCHNTWLGLSWQGFCSICKMGQDVKVYRFTPLFEARFWTYSSMPFFSRNTVMRSSNVSSFLQRELLSQSSLGYFSCFQKWPLVLDSFK